MRDISGWKNLNPDDEYSLGLLWQRFQGLSKEDPYIGFFTENVINSIAKAVTDQIGSEDQLRIKAQTPDELRTAAIEALDKTPLLNLVSDEFRTHIVELFVTCMWPRWTEVRNAMRKHLGETHDYSVYIGDEMTLHEEVYSDCDWKGV